MIPRQNVPERFTAPVLVEEGSVLHAVRQVHAAPVVTRGAGEVRDHLTDGAFASAVAVADELHLVGAERPGAGAGLSAGARRVDEVRKAHRCTLTHVGAAVANRRAAHLHRRVARPRPIARRGHDVAAGAAVRRGGRVGGRASIRCHDVARNPRGRLAAAPREDAEGNENESEDLEDLVHRSPPCGLPG